MRPPFNSFRPQARPHRPQQQHHQQQNNGYSNHHQHNGYQNPMNSQMMSNPMMGHMNNQMPMPNMPIHPQFFNNLPNMPQQQQQQLHQFAMPNQFNQLIPNLLGTLLANNNLMGHSLPLLQPNFFRPSLEPCAFTSQPQLNSFNPLSYPPVPNPHQNHQLLPPGFSEPRPQGPSVGIVNNTNGSGSKGNNFQNIKNSKALVKDSRDLSCIRQTMQRESMGSIRIAWAKGTIKKVATGLNGSDADNKAKENKREDRMLWSIHQKKFSNGVKLDVRNFPTKLYVEKKLKKSVSGRILDEEANKNASSATPGSFSKAG